MSRRAAAFTQAEIERVIRAVVAVGEPVVVEIGADKTIRVRQAEFGDKPTCSENSAQNERDFHL